ncbi:hypothetical protein BGZ73_007957 [Actinomortierella ambigua]|nr:hypothetical protein BGZ73_007957 [Actinomortierella ambigua]
MKDHARIFPTRLRTSSGSLREAYAGRHTPVIRSAGGFSDMASPALSTYSGRWGIPSGSVPGSGPSTPKAPVSRGEAGYMGKQTYIAFNKGAPRSAPMGYASTSHSMNSSFNFHGSQNDFHMHGADASGGAMSRRLVSLDSIYPYPWMTPTLHHAASARSPHDNMDSRFPPYGNISNVGSSSMAPMMRDAAAEEDRLDHELRALRRRGMTNDIYRSHSVGCLPHGANSSGSRSFQASVPGCYSPSTMTINRRPSIGSIRSLMTPIASGSQNLLAVDNGYSSSHSLSPSRPDATPESPAPSLPLPSIAGSLYQQQSYSQAPIRTEQKSGLRSVFSTPSLTSFARRRSSFSFKTALSSLVALPASPPSPTPSSISTSSSTASDLIISTPPIPSTDDLRESISGPPSAGVVLSADELMQAELSAIEMERAEQERAVTAATAAAAAAAAATSVPPSVLSLSPKDATMEETQPHGSLLGSQGTVSPNERSRASSVMSTDTDAMSAISTGSSFNQPTMLSMTRPPVPPHSHLSQSPNSHQPLPPLPQPFPLPLPPRQSSSRLLSIPRGGGDDGASINSSRSKRSIQLGNLKKMLKKPFSFAKELPLQRTLSSSAAKVVKATKGSKAATAAESPLLSDSSMRPSRQEERRSIRLPTKEDVRKFQWDYRRHVNPMHDDT